MQSRHCSAQEGEDRNGDARAGHVSGDIAILFGEGESWWQRGRQAGCVCASDRTYISMPRRDLMYCSRGSESTGVRERVQHYVAGTSPAAALQGDSPGVYGAAATPSTVFGALSVSQALPKQAGQLSSAGGKSVLPWHLPPLRRAPAVGKDPQPPRP